MEFTRSTINSWTVAELHGPFTIKTLSGVQNLVDELLLSEHPLLAFDLSDVPYMDSSAIGVVLSANRRYSQKGGYVSLFGANETIGEIFEAVKLGSHIPLYGTRDEFRTRT